MKTVIRWLAVLPTYIFGHILSILMIRFTYRVLSSFEPSTEIPFYGVESSNSLRVLTWSVTAHALGVYIGLDWGAQIAPKRKRFTAILLSVIPVSLIIISQIHSILNGYTFISFMYAASLALGLIVFWVKKNKNLHDSQKD